MANHASALKRARQNEVRRVRNRAYRTRVRNATKAVLQAVEHKDAAAAQEALSQAIPVIDRAAGKGVYHRNKAARKISRLTIQVNAIQA